MLKFLSKLAIAVCVVFCTAVPVSSPVYAEKASQEDIYEQLDLLMRIFQRVRSEYVDEVDDRAVIEAAIQGMLKSLDPHSTYMNADMYEQVRVQMEGEYGGLGIEVQMDQGLVKVVSPIDDTPADRAGIMGGDYITHIDGEAVLGSTLNEAVKKMRGPVGAPIVITVIREDQPDAVDIEIIRESIRVRSVRHRIEEDTIGYIRITTFNMQTGEGVENAVQKLRKEVGDDLDGVIIDLRNNPGGLLREAIRVSDAFLSQGEIVSTRGRKRQNNSRWYAEDGDLLDGLPIVVLVNAYSASASEIVAGALQDQRRAVVIGDKTFGKGTVQSEIRLGRDGDQAIRLTTARYYTPSGRSIQERGVEPDIEVLFPQQRRTRRSPRRESDLTGHMSNDQTDLDRAGEGDDKGTETPEVKTKEEAVSEQKEPATETPTTAAIAPTAPIVDVQLNYAIKLLKNMSSAPLGDIAHPTAKNDKTATIAPTGSKVG